MQESEVSFDINIVKGKFGWN